MGLRSQLKTKGFQDLDELLELSIVVSVRSFRQVFLLEVYLRCSVDVHPGKDVGVQ